MHESDEQVADNNGIANGANGQRRGEFVHNLNQQERHHQFWIADDQQQRRNKRDRDVYRQKDAARGGRIAVSLRHPTGIGQNARANREKHEDIQDER